MNFIQNKLLKHTYNDSIVLMQYTVELEMMPGVQKAAVMMGTPSTIQMLEESNLLKLSEDEVSYDDILIAVEADTKEHAEEAILSIMEKLQNNETQGGTSVDGMALGIDEDDSPLLWRDVPEDARIALISVPGPYAAAEAWQGLKSNRHVFLFSNNVTLADEIALKRAGKERGLLVMGPDCGTAIINGVPLGFANKIHRGNIGIVAAAGSGLQALTCQIDQLGCGISHAIGTGGRDLSADVQAITTRMGLDALQEDPNTEVICLLSKPPDPEIAEAVFSEVKHIQKPVVLCLLGQTGESDKEEGVYFVETIDQMAEVAVSLSRGGSGKVRKLAFEYTPEKKNPSTCLRGFYSGGTLAYEAKLLLQKELGKIYSNIASTPELSCDLDDIGKNEHIILDLGTDQFTQGRPHPMIDGRLRSELILRTAKNPDVAVVLFDLILGLGADPDPASSIVDSIIQAKNQAKADGHSLTFIATIVGTQQDPQNYDQQAEALMEAGVILAKTNAEAVRLTIEKLK